jgi:hypothetical protein
VILSVAKIRHFAILNKNSKKIAKFGGFKKKEILRFLEIFGRFLVFSF